MKARGPRRQLRELDGGYRALVERVSNPVFTLSSEGLVASLNPAFEALTGRRGAGALGRPFTELVQPRDGARVQAAVERVLGGEKVTGLELRLAAASGEGSVLEADLWPERGEGGQVTGLLGIGRDVTERKRAEEVLYAVARGTSKGTGARFLRELVEHLAGALGVDFAFVGELVSEGEVRTIAFFDQGTFREAVTYRLEGTPCERVVGGGLCCYPEGVQERFPEDTLLAELGVESYIGARLADSNGSAMGLMAVMDRQPLQQAGLAESMFQIFAGRAAAELERGRAEAALVASEEKYRALFEESRDVVFISTPEGKLLDMNPAGVELFGYPSKEELLKVNIGRELFFDPRDRERVTRLLSEQGFVKDLEFEVKRRDGERVVVRETATAVRDDEGRIVAFRGILRDVTERRQLEEQLSQAQKMEAVGRLAGGVAHDFNNLLTVIAGYSDLILARLDSKDPTAQEVAEIKAAGERAAELTSQLLALSRRQVLSPELVDLNGVVGRLERLLRRVIGEDVRLTTHLTPGLGAVRADPGQLEQVILNLAVNARDAMPEGGRLVIETLNAEVDDEEARRHLGLLPGPYVLLEVRDTGEGMEESIREHIFEPFFTTKETGRGSGLGLATVYGVVEQSGGHIQVESEVGRGTSFRIYLPRVAEEAPEEGSLPVAAGVPSGRETILLVEDEPPVRGLLGQFLRQRGYRVLEAGDGAEALEIAGRVEAGIDLLVTDVVMPRMGGLELAERLRGARPDLRLLFISGYTDRPQGVARDGGEGFLQKPFSPELLARTVRAILDGDADGDEASPRGRRIG